jgi:cytidine deaminase
MSDVVRLPDDWRELVKAARASRGHAYAPYSRYSVGAALRTEDGQVFCGCNVENASYGLTICAERVAMCSAVAAGARRPVVVCVSLPGQPIPCGSCRQFLHEFNSRLVLLLDNCTSDDRPECVRLDVLLPRGFSLDPPAK